LVGMRVLSQVISASSCERNDLLMGTFTQECATGCTSGEARAVTETGSGTAT
jgi:hypothetical protein